MNPLKLIGEYLNPFHENFIFTKFFSWFNVDDDNFIFTDLFSNIREILSYINPASENFFVYKLIELLGKLLEFLFIPSEERLTAISNTVTSKFDFIDSIKYAANSLVDIINGVGNTPAITLTLDATKYTNSSEIKVIDLSWYERYKTYGDVILTGFIYAAFIWRIFIRLSAIIQGAAGGVDNANIIVKEMNK